MLTQLQQGPGEAARPVLAADRKGPAPSRWTLRTIKISVPRMHGLSLSGVWHALHRLGILHCTTRAHLFSPDPDYASKRARLQAVLHQAARQPGQIEVVFLDEFGYVRWPESAPVWTAPERPVIAPRMGNNTQWRTIGSLNALTGRVDYLDNYIVGRRQIIAFYAQLAQAYSHADRVFIVQDNWSLHTHPDVLAALQQWPRLEIVALPTYAPWLNPIEKLWRWLRQDVLKLHRWVHDWPAGRQHVRDFLDQFAQGSLPLLRYVGLLGDGLLAHAIHDL